ncbi:GNAT family N-acetyltransferase [Sphingorhabdus lutea]|uniref:GNAT family N-acetyltransferase n=1 Tax=Sphingorhabdus lutea TaxID=1913578 RepID=A0A1L3JER7_9SPHN|nr:GNAT family N-acetyltransferase [Sphingorhabdus lutea]APG63638.1 GNAT family N-acetyltransferase [Sphingorhabdus lutea]
MKIRLANLDDVPAIKIIMDRAIAELQASFLTKEQLAASTAAMGLDMQLIHDGTYFCVVDDGQIVGCGGWSRRATLYGGSHSGKRDDKLLNPKYDRARIRAMYTHPEHVRRGIGGMIIAKAEQAARDEGFRAIEMAATMAGKPLYLSCGYHIESEWMDTQGAVPVPLATMVKNLSDNLPE